MNARGYIVVLVLLLPLGCGLKDYEERMDQEAKRAKHFDQTDEFLDAALSPPLQDGRNAWRFDVFLRVPRGCQREAARASYPGSDVVLYRFPFVQGDVAGQSAPAPRKDSTAPAAAAPEVREKPGWSLFVGCSAAVVATKAEFCRRVLSGLRLYAETELRTNFDPPRKELTDFAVDIDAARGLRQEFGRLEFEAAKDSLFQVFILEHDRRHIAVIFQTPKAAAADFSSTRDACLRTVDISDEAAENKARFQSTFKRRK